MFFDVLLYTIAYDRCSINSVLCILGDERILFSIQSSDITPNSTISIPHLSMAAPNPIPNGIFKRIDIDTMSVWTAITSVSGNIDNTFGYFDICKLIFGVLLNVIVCLFGVIICVLYVVCIN